MPKILVNDVWYEPIESAALYEREFESILLQKTAAIFPGYFAVSFKKTIQSDYDSAKADYALVAKSYSEWWVVEVELGHHSLTGHVLPQIQTLRNGTYGYDVGSYLVSKNPGLDQNRTEDLIRGRSPRVLVVVDRPRPTWTPELKSAGAELAVFEIFRSEFNQHVFRLNGFVPQLDGDVLSACHIDRMMPFLIRLESPAALTFDDDGKIEIAHDGRVMQFSKLDTKDAVWLAAIQRNPLQAGTLYNIVREPDGSLAFSPR